MGIKVNIKLGLIRLLSYFIIVKRRKRWVAGDRLDKLDNVVSLSKSEINEIYEAWGFKNFNKKVFDIRWYEVYKKYDRKELKNYIPDDFWYAYIDAFFTNHRKCRILDDKNFYDMYLYNAEQPKTICRKIDGLFQNPEYLPISEREAINLCKEEGSVIIKQSVNSEGGHGIAFWDSADGESVLNDILSKYHNVIIQRIIKQHPVLAAFNLQSINTVRIMVLLFNDEVIPLSSVLRMGVNNSRVDNASSGGIVCGIMKDGSLRDFAMDTKANRYASHPSGKSFNGVKIPSYEKCVNLVKSISPRFMQYSRLQSWDIAINEVGEPIIIEVNLTYGEIDFHQLCNGPILGIHRSKVLNYVFEHNPMLNKKLPIKFWDI